MILNLDISDLEDLLHLETKLKKEETELERKKLEFYRDLARKYIEQLEIIPIDSK